MAVLHAAIHHRCDGGGVRAGRAVLPYAVVSGEPSRTHHVDAVSRLGILGTGGRAPLRPRAGPYEWRARHSGLALAVLARRLAMRGSRDPRAESAEGPDRGYGLADGRRESCPVGPDTATDPAHRKRAFASR